MKRLLKNIMGIAAIAIAFSSCRPMDDTYKALGPVSVAPQNFAITLVTNDYLLLDTSNYARKTMSFKTKNDAAVSIPVILGQKYPGYKDKSSVAVTYATSPA